MGKNAATVCPTKLPVELRAYASPAERAMDPCKESGESESVAPEASIVGMGYSVGGAQSGESRESRLSSSRAVGRLELVALQYDCTNPQRVSGKPKCSA